MLGSGYVFQTMNSAVNMNLATIFKTRGVNFSVSAACASGSHAIGLGYMFIKNGMQDSVICGGAQETNIYSMSFFDSIAAFSQREDDPARASRPFDKSRDGLVPSGGAATVVLESLECARRRGAPILGEVIGYGFSSNGSHISNPTVEGPTSVARKGTGRCRHCAIGSGLHKRTRHLHKGRRRHGGKGNRVRLWRPGTAHQLHQVNDRARMLDGRGK